MPGILCDRTGKKDKIEQIEYNFSCGKRTEVDNTINYDQEEDSLHKHGNKIYYKLDNLKGMQL